MAIRKPLVIAGNRTAQLPAGDALSTVDVDITGAAEIGADLVDADEIAVYDASATAIKKSLMSRVWTYISAKITGAISGLLTTNLTASRAVVSDGSGKLAVSAVTSSELAQLSGKTLSTGATATVQTTKGDVTAGRLLTVGSFGWGATDSVTPAVDDCNQIIENGMWKIGSSTANKPDFIYGALLNVSHINNTRTQLAISCGSGVFGYPRIYGRSTSTYESHGTDYTAWVQFARFEPDGTLLVNTTTNDASGAKLQVSGTINLASGNVYKINNVQIIGARQAAIASAKVDYTTGNLDTEAEIITALNTTNGKINSILTALRNHGLIAP